MLGLKQKIVPWLLRGVHIDELHIGEHSVVIASSGINMGATPITNPNTVRTATVVVAANDSSAESKLQADYVCDGTDDHVEIQAALDALPGGGEVLLLEGIYYIEVSLALDSNQTLKGCGKNTVLTTTTADLDIVTATGGDGTELTGILIADLCVDGAAGGAVNGVGIFWTYVDYSKILNIWSQNNGEHNIRLTNCDFNGIIGNTCQGNACSGIWLHFSNNNTIVGNACQGNANDGIYLYASNNNTIVGNTCQGNAYGGISLDDASNNNTIVGNTCQGNTQDGIYAYDSHNNTISGNTCQGNTSEGIYLDDVENNTMSGNTCQGNSYNGIYVDSSKNNNIVGNVCLENSQDADDTYDNIFLVNNSDYNLINGNICRQGVLANTPRYGINISDDTCDRNCLIGNDLYDSGSTGDLNDVPTTNPTLKHDNRNLAGTGWLAEV